MDISQVLSIKYPESLWELEGNDYDKLIWKDEKISKPTEQELLDHWIEVDYNYKYSIIENKRRQEYAKRSDPLFFKWQLGVISKEEWVAERTIIQNENPYPDPINV